MASGEGLPLSPGAIEHVARAFLEPSQGAPNMALSAPGRELRWGKKGAISVDLEKQTWHDHSDGEGGGVLDLMRSFGGLSKAEALEWLEDQGYIPKREQPQQGGRKGQASGYQVPGGVPDWMDPKPVAHFDYRDDKGQLAYQVLKFPKEADRRYMQRRPTVDRKNWIWGLQSGLYGQIKSGDWFKAKSGKTYQQEKQFEDTTRWLYHRAEVLKAKKEGRIVCLVEGEKDVETIRAWGIAATTNAGGAKEWRDAFDDDLSGCHLVILNDNDDAGRTRAMNRGASLQGRASSVRMLDLAKHWPGMPVKADVSDWKDEGGGTKEAFEKLLANAPEWKPERPRSKFQAFTFDQLDDPAPELEYLIDGWLTTRGVSVMAGPSGSGKTFISMHAAFCIATGTEFLGHEVEKGGVIYQAGEGGQGIRNRERAWRNHFQIGNDKAIPMVTMPAKVDLFSKEGDTAAFIEECRAWALWMGVPLRAVFIDTLSKASVGANENDGRDMSFVLDHIAQIEEALHCHVCLVHHLNADKSKIRGHTSVHANVDQVVTVIKDEETGHREMTLVKQKDGEDNLKITFALTSVVTGYDARKERDKTSCVVLSVTEKEKLKKEQERQGMPVNPTEREILTYLFEALDVYGDLGTYDFGPTAARGKRVVHFSRVTDIAVAKAVHEEDQAKARHAFAQRFKRAMPGMIQKRIIGVERPHIWWTGKAIRGFPQTYNRKDDEYQRGPMSAPPAASPEDSPGLEEVLNEPEFFF